MLFGHDALLALFFLRTPYNEQQGSDAKSIFLCALGRRRWACFYSVSMCSPAARFSHCVRFSPLKNLNVC